jgi:hypothetical protein
MMRNSTAKYMCTQDYCPCPAYNGTDPTKDWLNDWTESQLNEYNRTKLPVSIGYTPIYRRAATPNYDNFWDCYADLKKLNQTSYYNGKIDVREISDGLQELLK